MKLPILMAMTTLALACHGVATPPCTEACGLNCPAECVGDDLGAGGGGSATGGGGSATGGGGSATGGGGSATGGGGSATGGGGSATGGGGSATGGGGSATGGGGSATGGGGSATGGGGSATGGGGSATGGGTGGGSEPTGYFVALTGNDGAAGTWVAPFRTIQHAVDLVGAKAGTINVRAGTYPEKVSIAGDGSLSPGPLVLQAWNQEAAVIDGTGLSVDEQEGLITIDGRSHVTVRGFEVRNFTSNKSGVPLGIYVVGGGTELRLESNHVHHIVQTQESCNGGDGFGIAVYGTTSAGWTDVVIDDNEVDHLKTGCSESLTVNGNVDGFQVTRNRVHDNDNIGIDAIGFEGSAPTAVDQARNGVIRGNTVTNITSAGNAAYGDEQSADGIYVDGAKNIVIEENLITRADLGIEATSEWSGRAGSYVLIRNNVIRGSAQAGISLGGYDSRRGGTDHAVVINNTLYDNTVEFQVQYFVTTTVFQNNLVFNATGDFRSGTGGVTFTTNLERTSAAQLFVSPPSDLRPATLAIDQGTALETCPAGWSCPSVWTAPLAGLRDVTGAARLSGSAIDVGAYEAP
jgi:hypothetical protein